MTSWIGLSTTIDTRREEVIVGWATRKMLFVLLPCGKAVKAFTMAPT